MSKITIRTTADEMAGDNICPGLQMSDHLPGPERAFDAAPAKEERAPERVRIRPVPRVKTVRRALGLTQEESARYGIPVGTLRDWEQGRTEPDQPARAYIRVIASNPEWCRGRWPPNRSKGQASLERWRLVAAQRASWREYAPAEAAPPVAESKTPACGF